MSRPPLRNDRGYQPLQGGLPPRPGGSLFDRRSDRTPPTSTPDYRQPSPASYDQRSVERRPVAPQPLQQSSNAGFLSKLTHRGHQSPIQLGGIFRVAKVCELNLMRADECLGS